MGTGEHSRGVDGRTEPLAAYAGHPPPGLAAPSSPATAHARRFDRAGPSSRPIGRRDRVRPASFSVRKSSILSDQGTVAKLFESAHTYTPDQMPEQITARRHRNALVIFGEPQRILPALGIVAPSLRVWKSNEVGRKLLEFQN